MQSEEPIQASIMAEIDPKRHRNRQRPPTLSDSTGEMATKLPVALCCDLRRC